MDIEKLETLLTVTEVAEMFEVPGRVVRKAAKDGNVPGHYRVLGKDGFDPELITNWTPPEVGTFGPRTPKREDGRQRYHIFLTVEEFGGLKDQYEITNPREAAKARRAERKAAKAAKAGADTEVEEGSPFSDFDV